ncbi:hypothetical protein [Streptomyces sp. NPDC007905]
MCSRAAYAGFAFDRHGPLVLRGALAIEPHVMLLSAFAALLRRAY